MKLDALGRVPDDDLPVIVIGVDMAWEPPQALILHQDGSLSVVPLDRVVLNRLETAVRFKELEDMNMRIAVEEHVGYDD